MLWQTDSRLLTKYIYNPVVSLRTLNYKVTVLGEVNKPGTYTIVDNQSNLLSALGLAGDLTKYGLRDNILVVRDIPSYFEKHVLCFENVGRYIKFNTTVAE